MTVRILLSEVHVPGLGLLIVEVGHLEFHGHGVALYDIGQKRLRSGTHQSSDIHVSFSDVTTYGRTNRGITQGETRFCKVSFAHVHVGLCAFIGCDGVIEIQLTRRLLLEERTDSGQVALRLKGYRLVLGYQCLCPVDLRLILLRVDDEKDLVLFHASSLFEHHLLEIAFHAGSYFHELLSSDLSRKLSVDLHVTGAYHIHAHYRQDFLYRLRLQEDKWNGDCHCHHD